MRIRINQIKMPLDHSVRDLEKQFSLRLKGVEAKSFTISRKSVDARNKGDLKIVYSVDAEADGLPNKLLRDRNIEILKDAAGYVFPEKGSIPKHRPVVVGSGPAGLFAALLLAENGYRPILLERGKAVEDRLADVNTFFSGGRLDPESNIQFGEGGAGTFSDGKINTGVKDKAHRKEKIIETFLAAGAPEEIAYINKPHIGTDYLVEVVRNIRNRIIQLGGEVHFSSLATEFVLDADSRSVQYIVVNGKDRIRTDDIILAVGHSARDTFKELALKGIAMEPKPFAIGLRIEHPQSMIGESQYGPSYSHENLPVADYKLTYRTDAGRGVYSFCMCPGGYVVNASSEEGMVVCNGMSDFARNSPNANSAIIVTVYPEDFDSDDVLAGVAFQRKYEELAFGLSSRQTALPIQKWDDFFKGTVSDSLGAVKPSVKGETVFADLNRCLPAYVAESIKEAIPVFGRRIRGFDRPDAVLTGVETRTSSPVRIVRDESGESINIKGIYPCGEGAGYAGGIMSAAIDGIKAAEALAIKYFGR